MKNRVITISREFGSGGRTIGKAVAEQLGIPCYDNEILQEIAKESGSEQSYIQETGEYAPGGFLAAAFSHPASGPSNADYLWEMQYKLIGQLAPKRSLRDCRTVRRLHPAGQSRLSAGVHPRRSVLSGKANRGGIRRAGKIPRTASEGQGQTPRRLSPLLHRHEVGSRAKLRPDTQQRHTGNRQMRRNHQEPVLKNIPSTKGSITKRQENHLLPFF